MYYSTEFTHSSHGATKGPISDTLLERFSGTEGPETANKICVEIKIALGRMNPLQVLTTPLSEILSEIPTPESGGDKFKAYQFGRSITAEWTKAYWTVRNFFKPGSPVAEQLKLLMKQLTCLNFGKPLTQIMLPLPIFLGFSRFFIS